MRSVRRGALLAEGVREGMRILPNGNIEITVQLMPDAYAAMKAIAERDGIKDANVVNLAIMSLNLLSEEMTKAGDPLGRAKAGQLANMPEPQQ